MAAGIFPKNLWAAKSPILILRSQHQLLANTVCALKVVVLYLFFTVTIWHWDIALAQTLKSPSQTPITQWKSNSDAEARLIKVYESIAAGRHKNALALAQSLTQDYPNFHLAQLVLGDVLLAQGGTLREVGDIQKTLITESPDSKLRLTELRQEIAQRVNTLKKRPALGTIPTQFVELPSKYRHAIAVDASQSRLYLFENSPQGLRLVGDFYSSVGKFGVEKIVEGDQRTPLGVYFITSRLDARKLPEFYGAGALPINYPNPLDQSRGKTGSGIWLHGAPPDQFSRPPLASDGCIVLSNPDIEYILKLVAPRTTPVVIARQLEWVQPQSLQSERQAFQTTLDAWSAAKSAGDMKNLLAFYAPDFQGDKNKPLTEWARVLEQEAQALKGRRIDLKDAAYLRWVDSADTMIVTFGEVAQGARSGTIKRQYWMRKGRQWQIIFEGVIG